MDPRVTPIDATLGAVVSGLTLSQMDASTWKTVEQAFHGDERGRASLQVVARQRRLAHG